jgi:hypothetical protein
MFYQSPFRVGNGPPYVRSTSPLLPTHLTDHASRYLLMREAPESTREDTAITAFQQPKNLDRSASVAVSPPSIDFRRSRWLAVRQPAALAERSSPLRN